MVSPSYPRRALPPSGYAAPIIDVDVVDPGNGSSGVDEAGMAAACGCSVKDLRRMGAGALYYLRSALKGGNINGGYAVCDADPLTMMIAKGDCPVERVQCRVPFTMRATAVAAAAIVTFTITPVGPAFLRELLLIRAGADAVPPAASTFVMTQIQGAGRVAFTHAVGSTGAGNVPAGTTVGTFGGGLFQNYVAPSGVMFSSNNALQVSIQNIGPDVGSIEMAGTYDVIRAG